MSHDAGDFAKFYQASKDDCLRAVAASTGDRQAAEDAVAEAFARAWAAWRSVRQHPAPAAWVVRTALNANVSWWRRRRREVPLLDARSWQASQPERDGTETACALTTSAITAALRRLPVRQREVVVLRTFLDLDTARTAEVLGIAPGTVTAHMARAVAALRADLHDNDHQEIGR
jgi:RNA polymerase sigma-70 factor (ECF subfamily)